MITHVIVELDAPIEEKYWQDDDIFSNEYCGIGKPLILCKDCRYKPTYAWSGCPMAGLNYVEYGYCYKAEREPKRKPQKGKKNETD